MIIMIEYSHQGFDVVEEEWFYVVRGGGSYIHEQHTKLMEIC